MTSQLVGEWYKISLAVASDSMLGIDQEYMDLFMSNVLSYQPYKNPIKAFKVITFFLNLFEFIISGLNFVVFFILPPVSLLITSYKILSSLKSTLF